MLLGKELSGGRVHAIAISAVGLGVGSSSRWIQRRGGVGGPFASRRAGVRVDSGWKSSHDVVNTELIVVVSRKMG